MGGFIGCPIGRFFDKAKRIIIGEGDTSNISQPIPAQPYGADFEKDRIKPVRKRDCMYQLNHFRLSSICFRESDLRHIYASQPLENLLNGSYV